MTLTGKKLADLRRDYSLKELSELSVAGDPFSQFSKWMDEALHSDISDATAMVLATVDKGSRPTARVVLLKEFSEDGFTFFTNYESRKGRNLEYNPNAFLHFFWAELERQVSISGSAAKISREESEAYFRSRPRESRIGAWASAQSSVIASRAGLEEKVRQLEAQYKDQEIPLPPYWGGFRLVPDAFEFWQGRASRLHDRICYELVDGKWSIFRRSP